MSSNSSCKANISGALSSLNIDVNESNNEELEATDAEVINPATKCAACGKEGDGDSMNSCNKCDLVQYCNAACKKKHKSKHKKKCERRVAELHDEKVFKEPPREECPICMLPLPLDASESTFFPCCGKTICMGCIYAMLESKGANLCAFCRTPYAESFEEEVARTKKLIKKGNAYAFYMLAGCYAHGRISMPPNLAKANELYLKAGELGCADAYFNLGNAYDNGEGVEIDTKKAMHYYELAAMNGSVNARFNLGIIEGKAGNYQRTYKHFILAAMAGHEEALVAVKQGFMGGIVTNGEYELSLRAYHNRQLEMKSETRDKAAAVVAFNETRGIG